MPGPYPAKDKIQASFTRPNDTNAYTAKDAVSNSTSAPVAISFADVVAFNQKTGRITGARLTKSDVSVTNATFRLWLFSASPTAINDNAAFTLLAATKATRIGFIDFTCTTEGTGSDCAEGQSFGLNIGFVAGGTVTALYGLLEATGAYTPAAQEIFTLELTIERD